jgi:hypothetical protein
VLRREIETEDKLGHFATLPRPCPCEHEGPELTVEEVGPMTGDLSEPAHGAAQQANEAAARPYEQAAAELDLAAAHCRVAATHFRGAEVPRGAAHAWAALGHLREAETAAGGQARIHRLKARRAYVEDHLRTVTGGTYGSRCRRLG